MWRRTTASAQPPSLGDIGSLEDYLDNIERSAITQALDVEVVRNYLSSTYRVRLQLERMTTVFGLARGHALASSRAKLRSVQYQLMNCEEDDASAWFEEYHSDAYSLLSLAKSLTVSSSEYAENLTPSKVVLGARNLKLLPLRSFKDIQHRFEHSIRPNLPLYMGQVQSKPKRKELVRARDACGKCVAWLLLVDAPSARQLERRVLITEGQPSILELWTEVYAECVRVYQQLCFCQVSKR